MKSTIASMTLSGLFFTVAAVTAGPLASAPVIPLGADSSQLLAYDGGERLTKQQMLQKQRMQMKRQDASKDFVRMMEEQPSAAGPQKPEEQAQPLQAPRHRYTTPAQRPRMSPH